MLRPEEIEATAIHWGTIHKHIHHTKKIHGIPLRLTISWTWFQNYNYGMHPWKHNVYQLQITWHLRMDTSEPQRVGFHPLSIQINQGPIELLGMMGWDCWGILLWSRHTQEHRKKLSVFWWYFGIDQYVRNPACNATIPFWKSYLFGKFVDTRLGGQTQFRNQVRSLSQRMRLTCTRQAVAKWCKLIERYNYILGTSSRCFQWLAWCTNDSETRYLLHCIWIWWKYIEI